MKIISRLNSKIITISSIIFFAAVEVWAGMPTIIVPEEEPAEDLTWWYVILFILMIGLTGAIIWKFKNTKLMPVESEKLKKQKQSADEWGTNSLDGDKELEWLRKNKGFVNGKHRKKGKKKYPAGFPQAGPAFDRNDSVYEISVDEPEDERILPVFSIHRLELARPFNPLSISNDEALMSAVEQTHDEFEEDEQVRELAVRILAAFKKRNSVEALSQVALYDLSSNLRSKAVSILSEFDHESVFETILLACADPTREVRAAAARGLFRLSFDRADAWTRIAESNDLFRMRQAGRAAIEGDLVERSFDRLAHKDHKMAYEAFSLTALLIKAGETEKIFDALKNHPNKNVRRAILHVVKITKEPNALEGLYSVLEENDLPAEIREEVDEVIEEIGLVAV